ncbi:uncharacterized protein At2g33490-like isoform X2 [Tasmannia lanceolata]|uniref:uncharacterized protein At2g33490-like isoform X2 n=1 Tax=Tasmannia lanceolata TaxID=3420 RepID=UPI004063CFA0
MKSSLKILRGFGVHKNDPKDKRDVHPSAQLDELAQASQDLEDMRNCYDSLLLAAAATTNSAYEFSESLRDMGACLLEKTALNEDEESGRVLLMIGKVQFLLQKLVDGYRLHIGQTITIPSESLLNELQTVEDMKRQCDEKRNIYEEMMAAQREKGKSRSSRGASISSQQLQTAQEEYDEEATLFVFRLKSLKQGQSRSLLTQAARHYAAQLNFFRKGLQSLEAIEPHVKLVTEQQHIDYQFSGLDDDVEDGDYDDVYDANDDGELSFDYGQNDHIQQDVVSTSRNSMELDQVDLTFAPMSTMETSKENLDKRQGDLHPLGRAPWFGSQSAPIFPDKKFDPAEIKDMGPSSARKFYTYVLPTPVDHKNSTPTGSSNPVIGAAHASMSGRSRNLWHSSPLEPRKHAKDSKYNQLSDPTNNLKAQSVLKESNIISTSIKFPPALAEGFSLAQFDPRTTSDNKKIKRHAFSGPLTSKTWSGKPIISSSGPISSVEHPQLVSSMPGGVPIPQPSTSPKVSPNASPPLMSSPKISELHELPRPPASQVRPTRPSSLIGHSAPLVSRSQELSATIKRPSMASHAASPLPTPPGTVPRSFSIPSSSQRAITLNVPKLLEAPQNPNITEEVASPPLTPISFTNIQTAPPASELTIQPGKTRGHQI